MEGHKKGIILPNSKRAQASKGVLTSVVSLTLASVWPTTALRALASLRPTKEEAGMRRKVVAKPAIAGHRPITLINRKQTTIICHTTIHFSIRIESLGQPKGISMCSKIAAEQGWNSEMLEKSSIMASSWLWVVPVQARNGHHLAFLNAEFKYVLPAVEQTTGRAWKEVSTKASGHHCSANLQWPLFRKHSLLKNEASAICYTACQSFVTAATTAVGFLNKYTGLKVMSFSSIRAFWLLVFSRYAELLEICSSAPKSTSEILMLQCNQSLPALCENGAADCLSVNAGSKYCHSKRINSLNLSSQIDNLGWCYMYNWYPAGNVLQTLWPLTHLQVHCHAHWVMHLAIVNKGLCKANQKDPKSQEYGKPWIQDTFR